MIKTIIIEDEPNGQELLNNLLQSYCPETRVLGIASSVKMGISLIKSEKPDLVFMDYQIEGGNGFDILDAFVSPNFKVIFITGYSEYAIKAIKYAALDYLLKPINIQELVSAVGRYEPSMTDYTSNYETLKANLEESNLQKTQMVVSSNGEHKVIVLSEILFIKSMQSFVEIHLSENRKLVSTEALKHYESLLVGTSFFKIHKSYIINMEYVQNVEHGRGGLITLISGEQIPIATRRKAIFLKELKRHIEE